MKMLKEYQVALGYVALFVVTYLVFGPDTADTINTVVLVGSATMYLVCGFKVAAIQSKLDIVKQYDQELAAMKPGTFEFRWKLLSMYLFVMSRS